MACLKEEEDADSVDDDMDEDLDEKVLGEKNCAFLLLKLLSILTLIPTSSKIT